MRARAAFVVMVAVATINSAAQETPNAEAVQFGAFAFTDSVLVRGVPAVVYDGLTGDISAWWDHSFSGTPLRLYIEPRPGGGFYEIFNPKGDGVLHATVTFAERGKKLMFVGPLGLAGKAVNLVTTYELSPAGKDSTRLRLSVHASGEIAPGLEQLVHKVWRHFLIERFTPFMAAGGRKKH